MAWNCILPLLRQRMPRSVLVREARQYPLTGPIVHQYHIQRALLMRRARPRATNPQMDQGMPRIRPVPPVGVTDIVVMMLSSFQEGEETAATVLGEAGAVVPDGLGKTVLVQGVALPGMSCVSDRFASQNIAEREFGHALLEIVVGIPGGDTKHAGDGSAEFSVCLGGRNVGELDVAGDVAGEEPEILQGAGGWNVGVQEHGEGLLCEGWAVRGEEAGGVVSAAEQCFVFVCGHLYWHCITSMAAFRRILVVFGRGWAGSSLPKLPGSG